MYQALISIHVFDTDLLIRTGRTVVWFLPHKVLVGFSLSRSFSIQRLRICLIHRNCFTRRPNVAGPILASLWFSDTFGLISHHNRRPSNEWVKLVSNPAGSLSLIVWWVLFGQDYATWYIQVSMWLKCCTGSGVSLYHLSQDSNSGSLKCALTI
jgi:hypothetical protein